MIRGLAITEVTSLEQYFNILRLCEGVIETIDDNEGLITLDKDSCTIFDDDSSFCFMFDWPLSPNYIENRKKCREITYKNFLKEFDNKPLDIQAIYNDEGF